MTVLRLISLMLLVAAAAMTVSACGSGATGASSTTAVYTTGTVARAPDFAAMGFTQELGSRNIRAGSSATVSAGQITVDVPAGALDAPVRFEVLGIDIAMFSGMTPYGMKPVLAFAFRVTDSDTGKLITAFWKPLAVTVSDPAITGKSVYYNISTDLEIVPNPGGLVAGAGELEHPASGATDAWMIASPAAAPAAGISYPAGSGGY